MSFDRSSNQLLANTCYKQPTESLVFGFDFSNVLDTDETIESAEIFVTPEGLTTMSPIIEGPIVKLRISGGQHRQQYFVECRVRTNLNNIREIDGPLVVRDGKDI